MKSAENVFEFLNCQHENIKLTVEKQQKKKIKTYLRTLL